MKPDYSLIPEPDRSVEARNVNAARRKAVIERQGGICKRAFCELPATDVDHIIPLWAKGSNKDENLEGLCVPHHKQKTQAEAKMRAKVNRIEAREEGTRRERKAIPSAPFQKGVKRAWGSRPFPKKIK